MGQTATANTVGQTLRTNRVRAQEVDDVFAGMQLTDPKLIIKQAYERQVANEKIADLNTVIDNRWTADIPASLARFLGLRPEASPRLSQVIVDTALAQPAGTQGIGFTAVKSGAINTPITEPEFLAMRDLAPITPEMNINRVVPISKPAIVAIAAAFAEQNPTEAAKRQPLDPVNAAAVLPLCETNNNGPNAPDLKRCVRASIGYTLARQGNKR